MSLAAPATATVALTTHSVKVRFRRQFRSVLRKACNGRGTTNYIVDPFCPAGNNGEGGGG